MCTVKSLHTGLQVALVQFIVDGERALRHRRCKKLVLARVQRNDAILKTSAVYVYTGVK